MGFFCLQLQIQGVLALCKFHYCEFHHCDFFKYSRSIQLKYAFLGLFISLTLSGTGQGTFTLMFLLNQILSAEFFSKISKLFWRLKLRLIGLFWHPAQVIFSYKSYPLVVLNMIIFLLSDPIPGRVKKVCGLVLFIWHPLTYILVLPNQPVDKTRQKTARKLNFFSSRLVHK